MLKHAAVGLSAAPGAMADIGWLAQRAMLLELFTYPKPGLVSHVDTGSHQDMDAATFQASAAAIGPFLADLAAAGSRLAPMNELRRIGLAAEAAMMRATGGVNSHRGAIFGLGLLCAAAGARVSGSAAGPLGMIVASLWGDAVRNGPAIADSHGAGAFRRYGAGGARQEAASGFETVYRIGLPALREGLRIAGGDEEAARLQCLFALIANVDDTTLLHRGGRNGLAFAQAAARGFLAAGGCGRPGWRDRALLLHRQFVAQTLSAGGCADLLAMTLFVAMMPDDEPPVIRQAA